MLKNPNPLCYVQTIFKNTKKYSNIFSLNQILNHIKYTTINIDLITSYRTNCYFNQTTTSKKTLTFKTLIHINRIPLLVFELKNS